LQQSADAAGDAADVVGVSPDRAGEVADGREGIVAADRRPTFVSPLGYWGVGCLRCGFANKGIAVLPPSQH
jgi:hypothetical protein